MTGSDDRNPWPPGTMAAAWWDLGQAVRVLGHEIAQTPPISWLLRMRMARR